MTGMTRVRALPALVLAVVAFALAGCYVPVRFDAEIEISRAGYYDMIFDGYLARAPLYDDLRRNKITPSEERERVAAIVTDLTRDRATQEADYIRQGVFKVNWRKSGDLLRTGMVSFVRRNENLLSVQYIKERGEITMNGAVLSPSNAKRLVEAGLDIQGELRVKTDARVVRHNATRVVERAGRETLYVWTVRTALQPAPRLVIAVR